MNCILCFGDSNTFGYDPRSYFGSQYPLGIRWTGLLQNAGWEVDNCGQNGRCIPREPQFPAVADLLRRVKADVVMIMLGSNDLLTGATAEETVEHMEALLRCMKKDAGTANILLIAPPPMQLGDWVQTRELIDESKHLSGLYHTLADELGIAFADAGEWGVTLTFDGVHFSPEGHTAFAEGLIHTLDSLK